MPEPSGVTPEKAAEWAAACNSWSATNYTVLREAVPALLAERAELLAERGDWQAMARVEVRERLGRLRGENDQLKARLEQQRADLATAHEQLGAMPGEGATAGGGRSYCRDGR